MQPIRSTTVRLPTGRPATILSCPTLTILPMADADEERAWDEQAARVANDTRAPKAA